MWRPDHFITNAIEYIRKKSKKRADELTIIDYIFNKNNSVNVGKQVVEKRITFLTTNGTLENKPNENKNYFRVKEQAKLASNDIIDNRLAPPKILNTPTEAQVSDILEESVTEDSNSNHTSQIKADDLCETGKQISSLNKETVTLKKFILEQLYVVKKSAEDLKNQQ